MPRGCGTRRALRRSAGGVPGAPAEGRPDGERRRSALRVPDDAEIFQGPQSRSLCGFC